MRFQKPLRVSSVVAGILGPANTLRRVVVTERYRLPYHVDEHRGERAVIIPGLLVHEPLEWGAGQSLAAYVEQYVKEKVV